MRRLLLPLLLASLLAAACVSDDSADVVDDPGTVAPAVEEVVADTVETSTTAPVCGSGRKT